MTHLSWHGSIVLLLVTVFLSVSVAAVAKPSASPDRSSPFDSEDASPISSSVDGFQRTVTAFQMFEKKGHEIVAVLQKLRAEAAAGNPGDTAKQQARFIGKLTELYPGSTYDGAKGAVPLPKNFVVTFNDTLTVDSIKEIGAVTVTYLLGRGSITLSYGVSSVTLVIDRPYPSRSKFSTAVIPAITDEAGRVLAFPGYKRVATDSVETSILNDAYQLLSQTNALRMDYFAADVMRYPALQSKALGIAGKGYLERHPDEYQKVTEPAKISRKNLDGVSNSAIDRIVGVVVRLLLLGVFATGVYWCAGVVIRRIKCQCMDKLARMHAEKYNSLAPMVKRSLKMLGTSLWGKNYAWSKKYYIFKRVDRWLLCDGKTGTYGLKSRAKNRVEVCMRTSNFKLKIVRLNGVDVDISFTCKDFSEKELTERLIELRSVFTAVKPVPDMTASELS